ncbi:hypothetical protein RF11_03176 [Thelohanellus kitauei]|uniref:Uncharacterized protein n=1 Tax=Thelohanellus kitauei TaxID=669202 RepID=A0A0C2MS10_THEKT|nr:hypothetical protein RF11_03176 [Thelohanellus kitauei]
MLTPAPVNYSTDFTSTKIAMLSTRDCPFQGGIPGSARLTLHKQSALCPYPYGYDIKSALAHWEEGKIYRRNNSKDSGLAIKSSQGEETQLIVEMMNDNVTQSMRDVQNPLN